MLTELVESLYTKHNTRSIEVVLSSLVEIPMFVKMCDNEGVIWGGSKSKVSDKVNLIENIINGTIEDNILNLDKKKGGAVVLWTNTSRKDSPRIYFKDLLSTPKCLKRL